MSNLQILNNSIRTLDNLYSLNDLHLASGNDPKHRPSLFARLETTKDLISEISKEVRSTDLIFKVLRGRNIQGTWACEELVLSYAMWISPKFHLIVLRAFLAMHKGEVKQQQLALPEPEKTYNRIFTESNIYNLLWLWFEAYQMNEFMGKLIKPLEVINSSFASTAYNHYHEYKHHIRYTADIIHNLSQGVELSASQHQLNTLNQVLRTPNTERIYRPR